MCQTLQCSSLKRFADKLKHVAHRLCRVTDKVFVSNEKAIGRVRFGKRAHGSSHVHPKVGKRLQRSRIHLNVPVNLRKVSPILVTELLDAASDVQAMPHNANKMGVATAQPRNLLQVKRI